MKTHIKGLLQMSSHRPVQFNENGVTVVFGEGKSEVLRRDGERVFSLDPGFRPHTFFTAFSVNIFEQVHADGHSKIEFYDKNCNFLAGSTHDLSQTFKDALRLELQEAFLVMWQVIVQSHVPSVTYLEFESLTIGTRVNLLALCNLDEIPVVKHDLIFDDLDVSGKYLSLCQDIDSYIDLCKSIFDTDIVSIARDACASGHLRFVSPITHKTVESDVSLCSFEVVYWYKCVGDDPHDVFYVIASLFHCEVISIYFPGDSLLLAKSRATSGLVRELFGNSLSGLLLRHLSVYAPMIRAYLAASDRHLALIYGEEHLGHHIWNELSGLNAFLAYPKPQQIPSIIEMSDNSEMFGRLDALFPELSGHVERITGPREALLATIYERRLFVLRPTLIRISDSLRKRITRLILKQDYIAGDQEMLADAQKSGASIICLQLRPENRTFSDPIRFLTDCMSCIADTVDNAYFVIDGHSTSLQTGSVIASFKQATASRPLMDLQVEISDQLKLHADEIGVRFISNVGRPLGSALFWIAACDFFVAPWGAGLVKTRWATNRPGVMLTNTWNLNNHHDLHIYDNPVLNEYPQPLFIVPEQMIVDRPDIPPLIAGNSSFSMNFDVVFDLFRPLLVEVCLRLT